MRLARSFRAVTCSQVSNRKEFELRYYETVFIARQDVTSAQVETMTQHYTSVIKTHGGEVTKTEFCGLRSLAYPIKKNKKGHYVLLNLAVTPEGISEVERQMKLNEDVLRYLSIRVDVLDNNPSTLMQQRHYREDFQQRDFGDGQEEGEALVVLPDAEITE